MAGFKNRILVKFSTKNVQHRLELLEKNSDTNLNKNRFLEKKKFQQTLFSKFIFTDSCISTAYSACIINFLNEVE